MISHDAHFDARVKQIILRYVEHCLILGPWIKGCVKSGRCPALRAYAKLFAQLEVVIFKAKPAGALRGTVWQCVGIHRILCILLGYELKTENGQRVAPGEKQDETRLCSIFDSTAKNLEGSILT